MDKKFLVDQLITELRASTRAALSASEVAGAEVRDGATPAEKREDARAAIEYGALAGAKRLRARRAQGEIDALATFRPPPVKPGGPIATAPWSRSRTRHQPGAHVLSGSGSAGITLTGPDGDGTCRW